VIEAVESFMMGALEKIPGEMVGGNIKGFLILTYKVGG